MLRDIYNRPLKDLRISVTDRSNFRCTYCMPFRWMSRRCQRGWQLSGNDILVRLEK